MLSLVVFAHGAPATSVARLEPAPGPDELKGTTKLAKTPQPRLPCIGDACHHSSSISLLSGLSKDSSDRKQQLSEHRAELMKELANRLDNQVALASASPMTEQQQQGQQPSSATSAAANATVAMQEALIQPQDAPSAPPSSPPSSPTSSPPGTPPDNGALEDEYKALYEQTQERLEAQILLCDQCKASEDALAAALADAVAKHSTAEDKAGLLLTATEEYTVAKSDLAAKEADFATTKLQLTSAVASITHDSEPNAFAALTELVATAGTQASEQTTLEGIFDEKLAAKNEAQAAYGIAAAAAKAANVVAEAKTSERDAACAGLEAAPSAPPLTPPSIPPAAPPFVPPSMPPSMPPGAPTGFTLPTTGVTKAVFKEETITTDSMCGANVVDLSSEITFSGAEDRTACAWYIPADNDHPFNLIEFGSGGSYQRFTIGSWKTWTNYGGVVVHTWGNYPSTADIASSLTDWNHICATWNQATGEMKPYFNGQLLEWVTQMSTYTQFETLNTGSTFNYWGAYDTRFCFKGQTANLLLYKGKTATDAEIAEIYGGTRPSSSASSVSRALKGSRALTKLAQHATAASRAAKGSNALAQRATAASRAAKGSNAVTKLAQRPPARAAKASNAVPGRSEARRRGIKHIV